MNKASRILTRLCAAVGFLFLLVSATPLTNWWARALAGPWTDPKGETLIVLGGGMLERNLIDVDSYWRATYATLVYREGGVRRVIVSGGGAGTPVATAMKQFLACEGLPPEAILTETDSVSTRENAINTARLLRGDTSRKVLLTSDYHMYRAWRALRKAGVNAAPRPFPEAIKRGQQWTGRWPAFLGLCSETVKIIYYAARGWI